ncbi:MAG: autotransporter-associated beta strand repeat-containing protein [Planctomycetia bacterium]|nr:autotransporter-associated beta strand repeat-containing protein [Planctomycetia bacterium]
MRMKTFTQTACAFSALILVASPLFAQTTYTNQNIAENVNTTGNNLTIETTDGDYSIGSDYVISGSGTLTKTGSGAFAINSVNTYTGNTTISGGTLDLTSSTGKIYAGGYNTSTLTVGSGATLKIANIAYGGNLGELRSNAPSLVLSGGTLEITESTSCGRGITLSGSGTISVAEGKTVTLNQDASASGLVIAGTGNLTITGGGTLALSRNGTVASWANTYNGTTTIVGATLDLTGGGMLRVTDNNNTVTVGAGGTLRLTNFAWGGSLGNLRYNSGNFVLNGGTLETTTTHESARSITLNADSTIRIADGTTLTLSPNSSGEHGIISGTGGLTKTGAGTLTLTGANTYTGGTTVSQGTLVLSNASAAGTGTITLGDANTGTNNVQLTLTTANTNAIVVSENGSGTVTIAGGVHTGVHSGTLEVNRDTYLTTTYTGTGDWWYRFDGVISGTGNLIINTLGGASAAVAGNRIALNNSDATSFSGNLIVEAGMLQINSASAMGTGDIILGNANTGTAAAQLRIGVVISNDIIVNTETSQIGTYNSMQVVASAITFNEAATLCGGSDRLTFSGAWSGDGNITIATGGGGQNRVTHDTTANTWTGDMTINSGACFQPGHASTLTAANSVTVNGTLQLNDVDQTIDGLSGSGTIKNIVATGGKTNTLTVGAGGASSTFSGTIQNSTGQLALTKTGAGTFTLINDANKLTYTGGTTLSEGRLNVSGALTGNLTADTRDGAAALAVFSPGENNAVGTTTLGGTATFADAILKIEVDSTGMDLLSVNSISFTDNSVLEIDVLDDFLLTGGLEYELLNSTDALPTVDWEFLASPSTSYLWNFRVAGNSLYASVDANAVPEPATWALLVLGAFGLYFARKKHIRTVRGC